MYVLMWANLITTNRRHLCVHSLVFNKDSGLYIQATSQTLAKGYEAQMIGADMIT